MASEESGAYMVWTGILDNILIAKQETMEDVHAVSGDVRITALLKECRGLDNCVRNLRRTRHNLIQAIRGEVIRARIKVSAH